MTGHTSPPPTSSSSPPSLTPQQRRLAVIRSRDARVHRAAFRKRIGRGELTMADVFHIADEDPVVAKMKILDVLAAFRGITPHVAAGYLADARVHPERRLRGVGLRQRTALVHMIDH